ncbi:MAG: type IV pilin protein [Gammaproteobacteria bacterium]|nr:MAG: type IV pilin protein [Gammaproteobacteria bacterium]
MLRKQPRGFTLIELVIAMVVIGILAAIAFPSYTNYMLQVRRSDCAGALIQLASVMERDFSRNNNQYRDVTAAGINLFPNTCPIDGGGATTYTLTIPVLTPSTYTLVATPGDALGAGPQANDPCGTLTLTNLLQKGQAVGTVADCWR